MNAKLLHSRRSKKRNITLTVIIFCILLVLSLISFISYVHYVRSHMRSINDDGVALERYDEMASHGKNEPTTMVFYKDNCSHCKHVVPYYYVINSLVTPHRVKFVDVADPSSKRLGSNQFTNNAVKNVPGAKRAELKNGSVKWSDRPLIVTGNVSFAMFCAVFMVVLYLLAIILVVLTE